MTKAARITTIALTDIVFINLAFLVATLLYTKELNFYHAWGFPQANVTATLIKIAIYWAFSLYSSIWEYASVEELMKVVGAVTISNVLTVAYMLAINSNLSFGVYIMVFVFEILLIGGNRFSYRLLRRIKQHGSIFHQADCKRILIVGSGSTASMVATEIKTHPNRYGRVVGFIDDDRAKKGSTLGGVKILGDRHEILSICRRCSVDEIILAIPTTNPQNTKEILEECKRADAKVTIVPGIVEIIDGKVSMQKIRPVELEDLLGRDVVNLSIEEIANYIEAKTVMVTGGGGSIGSELCRQIIKFKPAKLIVLDIYENNVYDLQFELLAKKNRETKLEILIASVRERNTVFKIIGEQRPDIIFHAAAHKHVQLMEASPKEAVKNNVFGTLNVTEAAHKFKVKHFIFISTDKAVNPTSVMGATKRLCEMIVQALANISKTRFVAVRFGNVLGSNGSVIPLFTRQIKEGGPVTITHKDVVRYFMTIPEAAQLTIQAGAFAKGGEIFVLDMGEPARIYDLALDLIKLSGLKPYEDIDIEFTGLRPGEKLYEELLMAEEGLTSTAHNKIYIGAPAHFDFEQLRSSLAILEKELMVCSNEDVRGLLKALVPTYNVAVCIDTINSANTQAEIGV